MRFAPQTRAQKPRAARPSSARINSAGGRRMYPTEWIAMQRLPRHARFTCAANHATGDPKPRPRFAMEKLAAVKSSSAPVTPIR